MANIKAIIKAKNKASAKVSVYIYYYRNAKEKTLLSTGVRCKPSDWNAEKEEIRKSDPSAEEKNDLIKFHRQKVFTIQKDFLLRDRELTIAQLKEHYNEDFKGSTKIKDPIKAIEFMIERKSHLVKPDVIKDYKALSKHLGLFLEKEKRFAVLEDIDNQFGNQFHQFLLTNKVVPVKNPNTSKPQFRPLAKGTIGKQLKNLKVLMRFCREHELIQENRLTKVTPPTETSDSVALSEEELDKIEALELPLDCKHDEIRDLFLVGCETGLRYSDLERLRASHIDNDTRLISIRTKKSNKTVKIPLSERVKRIISKRHGHFPKAYNSVTFNVEIKKICKQAGLDQMIVKSMTIGNCAVEKEQPKYQMVASHTCRRTFCTIQFKNGMPSILIRKISGHAKEADFLRYIKIGEEEAAEMMLKVWNGQNCYKPLKENLN